MKALSVRPPPATVPRVSAAPALQRPHTPLLPMRPLSLGNLRGIVTVMTGIDAGRVAALDRGGIVIGRDPEVDLCCEDPGVSRRHARIGRDAGGDVYVEDLGSTNGTFLRGLPVSVARLEPGDYLQLGGSLLVRFDVTDATDERLKRQLYESSVHDPLTRAYNRRYLADRLAAEVAHARRACTSLAALMLDIDHFKDFNDRYGHLPGDRALCFVAAQVMRNLRAADLLARFGGEEFVVLSRASGPEATNLAERLRAGVESLRFVVAGTAASLTVSVGVASIDELDVADDPSVLVRIADERLYAAKQAGRNRVCTP